MLCAELERLEAEFQSIVDELENPDLTDLQRDELQKAYYQLIDTIKQHQAAGHEGGPCFEGIEEEY